MRELKFRVYDKTGGYYIAILDNDCFGIKQVARIILELKLLKHEYIIEQYTGLKDKNGKEIYEGDIARCSFGESGVVELRHGAYCVVGDDIADMSNWKESAYEIIGNIHEAPELIEKDKQ